MLLVESYAEGIPIVGGCGRHVKPLEAGAAHDPAVARRVQGTAADDAEVLRHAALVEVLQELDHEIGVERLASVREVGGAHRILVRPAKSASGLLEVHDPRCAPPCERALTSPLPRDVVYVPATLERSADARV